MARLDYANKIVHWAAQTIAIIRSLENHNYALNSVLTEKRVINSNHCRTCTVSRNVDIIQICLTFEFDTLQNIGSRSYRNNIKTLGTIQLF